MIPRLIKMMAKIESMTEPEVKILLGKLMYRIDNLRNCKTVTGESFKAEDNWECEVFQEGIDSLDKLLTQNGFPNDLLEEKEIHA